MACQSPGDQHITIHRTINIYLILKTSHWGLHKMADILQTTFSNAFSWLMIITFWLIFHDSLFLKITDNTSALVQVTAEAMPTKIHNVIWHHLAARSHSFKCCSCICICVCVCVCVCMYICMLHAHWSLGRAVELKFLLDRRWFSWFVSGHSICWRFSSRDPLGLNPAFSRGRQLVSFRLKNHLPVLEHRK